MAEDIHIAFNTLSQIAESLRKRAEWHRNNQNDPHGISNAVFVSLSEVSEAIEEAIAPVGARVICHRSRHSESQGRMKTRSKSYQRGAADERAAILRNLRQVNKIEDSISALDAVVALRIWIEARTARYNRRKGGMQTRRGK